MFAINPHTVKFDSYACVFSYYQYTFKIPLPGIFVK
jgi:hypothetical protein